MDETESLTRFCLRKTSSSRRLETKFCFHSCNGEVKEVKLCCKRKSFFLFTSYVRGLQLFAPIETGRPGIEGTVSVARTPGLVQLGIVDPGVKNCRGTRNGEDELDLLKVVEKLGVGVVKPAVQSELDMLGKGCEGSSG
nr:hypothetical protein HmN_000915700 [Hymenolepis microstoma]